LGKFAKIAVIMNLTADELLDIIKTINNSEQMNGKRNR